MTLIHLITINMQIVDGCLEFVVGGTISTNGIKIWCLFKRARANPSIADNIVDLESDDMMKYKTCVLERTPM